MSVLCPNGHTSEATDYCDVCGAPIAQGAGGAGTPGGSGAPGGAGAVVCPNGHASASTDYCDTCGAPIGPGTAGTGSPAVGAPPAPPTATVASVPTGTRFCPNCGTANLGDALFCEGCGYDFTTGAKPRAAAPPPDAGGSLDLSGLPATGPGPAAAGAGAGAPGAGVSGAGAAGTGGGPAPTVVMPTTPAPPPTPPPTPPATPPPNPDAGAPVAPAVPLEWVVERWVDPGWYDLQDSQDPCPSPGLPVVVPLTVRSVLVGRVSFSRNIHPTIDCSPDIGVSRRHCQLTTDGSRWWVEDLQSSNGTYVGPDSGPLPTKALVPGTRRELEESDRIYVGAWTRLVVRRATEEEKAGGV